MNDHSPAGLATEPEGPRNIQAEQLLLGAILYNSDVMGDIGRFDPACFFDPLHRQIYEAASQMVAAGQRASPVTLQTFFDGAMVDGSLTVAQYLGRLSANAGLVKEAGAYVREIRDCHAYRQFLQLGRDIVVSANQPTPALPASKLIEQIDARLDPLRERAHEHRNFTVGADAIEGAIDDANDARQRDSDLIGVPTGLAKLDEHLGGLMPSELIVLGGATSSGKSALGLSIALEAVKQGIGVGFFALEMSAKALARRILAIETGVSPIAIRRGAFKESDMERMLAGWQRYKGRPLYINDSSGLTITQLAAESRRLCRTQRIGLLVVDYLQLLKGTEYRGVNRTNEVADISQGLKGLAKELDVPILALAQLSRKIEERAGHRPILADLREGGTIEHDADLVLFVHRDEYWTAKERPAAGNMKDMAEWQEKMDAQAGKAEVIVAKFREGPLESIELAFDGPRTLFTDRG